MHGEGLMAGRVATIGLEAGGPASIEAELRNNAAIQWQVDHGWSLRTPRQTAIVSGVAAPLAAAVRERSDRYAASTHAGATRLRSGHGRPRRRRLPCTRT